jgi:hypothetical protein
MNVRKLIISTIAASTIATGLAVSSAGIAAAKPIDDYNACKAQLGRGSGIDCCYVLHGSLMLDKNGNYIACILDGRDRVVKPRS